MTALGPVGLRAHALWLDAGDTRAAEAAAEAEELGYSGFWFPTHGHDDPYDAVRRLLMATRSVTVATGIVNVWDFEPGETAAAFTEIERDHPDRFLLGLGVGHALFVDDGHPGRYHRPAEKLRSYVEAIETASTPVPRDRVLLAAHGPRMLEVARDRAGGSHPYLITTAATRRQRAVLGEDLLLAPEMKVILETDPETARAAGRARIAFYLTLPNFVNSLLLGDEFTEADLADGGSDRLIDAVIAWGDEDAIHARLQEHLDAGADHVSIQVIGVTEDHLALEQLRRLAPALLSAA